MCSEREFLDSLVINTYSNPENRRSLTRPEAFVLGWFISHTTGRNYPDMMRDTKLSHEQCRTAVRGLIKIDLLRQG